MHIEVRTRGELDGATLAAIGAFVGTANASGWRRAIGAAAWEPT